jgi:hypothetical protein
LNLIRVMPAKGQDTSMQPSLIIARLVGPVFCVIGIGVLANQAVYREMAAQFLAGYPFIYLSGILALVAGLAILNVHPDWTRDWRSLITALGWVTTCAAPSASSRRSSSISSVLVHGEFFTGAGIVLLTLGGFVTFNGYAA